IVRFQASATEQEIWRGALGAANAREHVLVFFREIKNIAEFSTEPALRAFADLDISGHIDGTAQAAMQELKRRLREQLGETFIFDDTDAHLRRSTNEKGDAVLEVTPDHLTDLCNRVYVALEGIINRQIDVYWEESSAAGSSPDPTNRSQRALELERLEHQRFGTERAPEHTFVGRERELEAIRDYLSNDSRQPLVIHGASGCGKTALLARAAQKATGRWKPLIRYIGIHSRSSDIRSMLSSLCQELRQRHPRDKELPGDVPDLIREWHEHLEASRADEPLVCFLDALDQLADADKARSLNWIPFEALPNHVKLIVSCLSDRPAHDPAGEPFTALQRRGIVKRNFIELDALSLEEARIVFFDRWLPEVGRTLNDEQQQAIQERLQSLDCRQPLYLKILSEEARLWRSYDEAPALGGTVPELLGTLFQRLSDLTNHGPTLESALGYIASARRGLTEQEILEVLYRDADYRKYLDQTAQQTHHRLPDNPKRIPIALWSRLRFDLAPYFAEPAAPGGTVLNFYHRQVGDYVREHFLDTPAKRLARRERLAKYFAEQDFFLESLEAQRARARRLPPTPRPANVRKVEELPWQLLQVAKLSGKDDPKSPHWDAVADLFTDLHFLEAKAEAQT
ncbi:MAG TPA: ATP-binding protein, partial [Bryobacteraceae bacterium]